MEFSDVIYDLIDDVNARLAQHGPQTVTTGRRRQARAYAKRRKRTHSRAQAQENVPVSLHLTCTMTAPALALATPRLVLPASLLRPPPRRQSNMGSTSRSRATARPL